MTTKRTTATTPDPWLVREIAARHQIDHRTLAHALRNGVEEIRTLAARERTRDALAELAALHRDAIR